MINNYWEEQNMDNKIHLIHEEKMAEMGLPKWVTNLRCPFCKKELFKRSIRTIGIKFNTRNIGDIIVEVLCENCSKMDTLYFRDSANMSKFVDYLRENSEPTSEPLIEEDMYKLNYNNLLENIKQGT